MDFIQDKWIDFLRYDSYTFYVCYTDFCLNKVVIKIV